MTKDGVRIDTGFINHLQVVSTINYYTTADLHNLQSLHTILLSLFQLVFTTCSLELQKSHKII
jgi:hypothetical protein